MFLYAVAICTVFYLPALYVFHYLLPDPPLRISRKWARVAVQVAPAPVLVIATRAGALDGPNDWWLAVALAAVAAALASALFGTPFGSPEAVGEASKETTQP